MKFTSSQPSQAHCNSTIPARTKPNSIRQSFARQTFQLTCFICQISSHISTVKVLRYTVQWNTAMGNTISFHEFLKLY